MFGRTRCRSIFFGNAGNRKFRSVASIERFNGARKISERCVPVDSDFVCGITALLVGVGSCRLPRSVVIALPFRLGANIFATRLRTTHKHSRNWLFYVIRCTRAMMRVFRIFRAVTGYKRHIERVLAEQVIENLDRSLVIFLFTSEVIGMQKPYALVRCDCVGTPYKVILCHDNAKTFFCTIGELIRRT